MTGSPAYQRNESRPLPKGYIFNALLFLIFFLPVWDLATFKAGPVITNLREMCLLLLPIVYFFYPRGKNSLSMQTKYWILLFFIILVATELIKKVYYGLGPMDAVKNFRITLPVLSGLLICLQGKKIDPKFCIKTVMVALIISYILTPLLVIIGIQPSTFSLEGRSMEVGLMDDGRFSNNNFEFSLIGIALLFYIPKVQTWQRGFKKLILFAAILSVLILILSFNRTVLAAGALLGIILLATNLEVRILKYILITVIITGAIGGYFYTSNPIIQRQVDQRILVVFEEENALAESVYYNNRDVLYETYINKLKDYWMLGMPGGEPVINFENMVSSKSDISLYNIWIRYGLLSIIVFTVILILIYVDQRKKVKWLPENSLSRQIAKAVVIAYPFYVLISLNIDALVAHNAILFLLLLITFSEFKA